MSSETVEPPQTRRPLEPLVGRLLSAVEFYKIWSGDSGPERGSAADLCREAAEWITKMRADSVLIETPDGPRVMLPYSFMRD